MKCVGCGLTAVDPRPDEEDLRDIYDESYFHDGYLCHEAKRRAECAAQVEALTADGLLTADGSCRVLDVGCGLGWFLALLRDRGHAVWGVDGSDFARRYAEEKHQLVVTGVLQDLPDIKYDLITFWDSFGHLLHPDVVLEYCGARLNVGGSIVFKCPNFDCPSHRLELMLARRLRVDTIHATTIFWRFSPATLTRLVRKYGLEVTKSGGVRQPPVKKAGGVKIRALRWGGRVADEVIQNRREFIVYARRLR